MRGAGLGLGAAVAAVLLGSGYLLQSRRYPPPVPPAPRPIATPAAAPAAPPPPVAPARPAAPPGLGFTLTEASAQAGLIHTPTRFAPHPSLANVAPWLSSIGAAAAVVDFDGDGWRDVFLTNAARDAKNRLFRNNGDGTFTDAAAKAGLADLNARAGSMRPLFFDADNDGDPDLLLTTSWCPRFFLNNGDGTFRDATPASGLAHCGVAYASNALDFDADGDLDLVIADYFKPVNLVEPHTTRFMPNSGVAADNGGPILVYRNEGRGVFAPVPDNLGIVSRGWTQAVGIYDLRGTGRPDLYFATDFNSDQVYLNEGGGRFASASTLVEQRYGRNAMSAEIADLDNDGRPAVFVTNIYEPPYNPGENILWKWEAAASPRNLAEKRGAAFCGWAWGAKFLDLDNDGWQDLAITNGNISANPAKDYRYAMTVLGSSGGEVMEDTRNWPAMGDASLAGYQRKCVLLHRKGRFEDVTDLTGFKDDRSDGRALAAIDVLNDGSLSLVEANQNQPLRFYRNRQRNKNRWLGFKLVGVKSNRDAFGARVRVRLKGLTLSRENQPANGFMSQSDDRLHFGLGAAPELESVEILWPSGLRSTLKGLALDRYHTLTEGDHVSR